MNTKTKRTIEIVAALFVLFSIMLGPLIPAAVSPLVTLGALGVYIFVQKDK